MIVEIHELEKKLVEYAHQVVDEQAARYYAQEVIESHIRKSPRSNVLKSAISDVEVSIHLKETKISYDINLPSYISINFNGHGPLTFIKQIHDELESRANSNGIAVAAFTNGKSMHTLHAWVQGLAKRGLVAIAVCNGGPRSVVPFNGTRGLFGTNPIAYGLPGKEDEIFCVDMATSEIPYFEILDAQKDHKPLKQNTAVDSNGEFTTDANQALDFSVSKTDPTSNIVPIGGGYKGYYLVYLMEVLTSALIGMPSSPEMSTNFVPEEHGAILMVMSPKMMGSQEKFQQSVEALHFAIKAQKPKLGTSIDVPGQRNNTKFNSAPTQLDVDDALLKKLSNHE